jgi:hypothetical protein
MDNEQVKGLDTQESLKNDPIKEKEILLKEREVSLKELETKAQMEISHRNVWFTSPLLIGIFSALFGLIGTAVGAALQGYSNFQLEKQKFETNFQLERQKFEFSLIQKALENENKLILTGSDGQEAAKRLLFLVKSGVIKTLDADAIGKLANSPNDLPTFTTETTRARSTFLCQIVNGVPTTMVDNSYRVLPFIQWKNGDSTGKLSATEQCKIVSSRLQEAQTKGILNYITSGQRNGNKMICGSRTKGNCEFELFSVDPSVDPNSLIEDFVKWNSGTSPTPLSL